MSDTYGTARVFAVHLPAMPVPADFEYDPRLSDLAQANSKKAYDSAVRQWHRAVVDVAAQAGKV